MDHPREFQVRTRRVAPSGGHLPRASSTRDVASANAASIRICKSPALFLTGQRGFFLRSLGVGDILRERSCWEIRYGVRNHVSGASNSVSAPRRRQCQCTTPLNTAIARDTSKALRTTSSTAIAPMTTPINFSKVVLQVRLISANLLHSINQRCDTRAPSPTPTCLSDGRSGIE
jgi:hypothetical protein